jgi:uncharacterized protein YcfL
MKKRLLLLISFLLVSCSTNKALVEYNRERMDKNEEYLRSVESKTVPKGEIKGTTRRVPLEKEADR